MKHYYRVTSCQFASPTVAVFTMHNTQPDQPLTFQPGQYVAINFLYKGRPTPARCFSIISSPTEQDYIQIAMRVNGKYTQSVTKHFKQNDLVTLYGPYGKFIFNAKRDEAAVLIAGGIGIAPFLSMIRYYTRLKLENRILLIYSCRTQDDASFTEGILDCVNQNPNLSVLFVVDSGDLSRFPQGMAVNGRIEKNLLSGFLGDTMQYYRYFLCGPPPFMKSMYGLLESHHIPRTNIMSEAFNYSRNEGNKSLGLPGKLYVGTAALILLGPSSVLANDIVMQHSYSTSPTSDVADQSQEYYEGEISNRENDIESDINQDDSPEDIQQDPVAPDENEEFDTPSENDSGNDSTQDPPGTPGIIGTPSVVLSASTSSVIRGSSLVLSWNAKGTDLKCSASGGWSGSKATSGSQSVTPTKNTTYSLICSNNAGSTKKSVTITVTDKPTAPSVVLSASSSSITSGQSTTLTWTSGGTPPTTCMASGGWSGSKSAVGSQAVSPTTTTTYAIACSNSIGSSNKSITITVNHSAKLSFSASATTITEGDSVNLAWSTSGSSTITCTASNAWGGGKPTSGNQTVWPASTRTYTLQCSNAYGSQTKSITITVNPATNGS